MTSNIHLRGIDAKTLHQLKQSAKTKNTSVNQLILLLIKKGLGISRKHELNVYHDLDKLAGTWSKKDAELFEKQTAPFEEIDKELW